MSCYQTKTCAAAVTFIYFYILYQTNDYKILTHCVFCGTNGKCYINITEYINLSHMENKSFYNVVWNMYKIALITFDPFCIINMFCNISLTINLWCMFFKNGLSSDLTNFRIGKDTLFSISEALSNYIEETD